MNSVADVTVVIPCFNAVDTIERALISVVSQEVIPKSIILIDDASTDGTSRIIRKLARKYRDFNIQVIENYTNQGPGLSRNIGWNMCKTEWVAFLDADDAWYPSKLRIQLEFVNNLRNADVVCCRSILANKSGTPVATQNVLDFSKLSFNSLLFKNTIHTRSVIIRSNINLRFSTGLSEDYLLWLQLLQSGRNIYKINLDLCITYRKPFEKGGLSSMLVLHEYWELKRLLSFFRFSPIMVVISCIFSILKFIRRIIQRMAVNFTQ